MNSNTSIQNLAETACALMQNSRGILAADESTDTIEKRFASIGLASTQDSRRDYREMLFGAPGLGAFISGAILYDETIRQTTAAGTPMAEVLRRQNILPGIKVDRGAKSMAGFPGEKVTEGLDGLRARLEEYAALGARFTKWRGVISIGPGLPSLACVQANAEALARFAALTQEAGMVPIVEPENLMDGSHSIARHGEVTQQTLAEVFTALRRHRVSLEGMLLKINMVLPGKDSAVPASASDVAQATLTCLKNSVPPSVPGIVFLSGGQSEIEATENLSAMTVQQNLPWPLGFSYGRALQDGALRAWNGNSGRISKAQSVLLHRARMNALARTGQYSKENEVS